MHLKLPPVRADALIDPISAGAPPWVRVGKGPAFGTPAAQFAGRAHLVVALLNTADHRPFKRNPTTGKYDISHGYESGHLAVVLPGTTPEGYPYVVCGSTVAEGRGDGDKAVRGVWCLINAPNVRCYRTTTEYPGLVLAAQ